VQVLEVDSERQRISLSLKALKDQPTGDRGGDEPDEDLTPLQRIEPSELKGGTGDGGSLFGNPDDF
jgi:hypothetical protein